MTQFVIPPSQLYPELMRGGFSYAHYNYLRPGLIPKLRRTPFERALAIARPLFHTGDALDMGCADGVLLPSLAKYFNSVVGVDPHAPGLETAQGLLDAMHVANVSLICNNGLTLDELRAQLGGRKFRVAFVLETLEHLGDLSNFYESRADFVEGVLSLLEPGGWLIASVPRMVGLSFLAKYLIQSGIRMPKEEMAFGDLMRASFLRDVSRVEPQWVGGHLGFNHLRLTEALRRRFDVSVTGTLTSVFYVIRQQ